MRTSPVTPLLICALAIGSVLAACSPTPQPAPDAITLLQNLPQANPAKYANLRENKTWENPYLIIRFNNVGLLSAITANEELLLKPEEVLDALAHLPPSAWPYGRAAAILVQEPSGTSGQEQVALRRNRGAVAGALERARIEIFWMPEPKH